MRKILLTAFTLGFAALSGAALNAAEETVLRLTLEDGKFAPAELRAPANRAFTLTVRNAGKAAMEFESKGLKLEKVIAAGAEQSLHVRPMKPGRYAFVDEFNEDVAKGALIVE
ncbi:hypothetical protein M2323_001505 [Rhodoblastus acidophilus]|uniref:cupredoxin domain-containing protein n=1 Tax=Rhodoblastus acidophilus TaxID=1074 RepID=UPI00161ED083|nr:cupredoxin domain-containing protein [Rhodoblastus acidophilus]MCW2283896.1 hypothetical protein [Rhodoblastus acidophilus]MCW2332592.1 hypothetical protein [Rhodoblastus acidophilus]